MLGLYAPLQAFLGNAYSNLDELKQRAFDRQLQHWDVVYDWLRRGEPLATSW